MSYTNAQLVRREIGDGGLRSRDTFSGDASTKVFQLSGDAVLAGSYTVKVGGVTKTDATDYAIDVEWALLTFVAAPGAGTDNIEVIYRSVEVSDGDISESLRQLGLTATDTADIGRPVAVWTAGAMLAEWVAAKLAYRYDISKEGQSLSRSQAAQAWQARAERLYTLARQRAGLTPMAIIKIDGYNVAEVTGRDIMTTSTNVRRRFYGDADALP